MPIAKAKNEQGFDFDSGPLSFDLLHNSFAHRDGSTNHFAYIEPVATDPEYRRMGLGKAAVLQGIRRSVGFEKIDVSGCWVKNFAT